MSVQRGPWRLIRHDGWSRWERVIKWGWGADGWNYRRTHLGPTLLEQGAREGDS